MMPMMRTNSWIPTVFNDLFDADYMPKANATAPAINVKESDKAYTVELAAPGISVLTSWSRKYPCFNSCMLLTGFIASWETTTMLLILIAMRLPKRRTT